MSIIHPGPYVRAKIFPPEMTVSEASEKLGIGRPALSKFLNGNSSLSVEMAGKLERFFGCSAEKLLRLQADYDAQHSIVDHASMEVGQHVPVHLKVTSNEISAWSENISARTQLPVLLRILVHSTGQKLTHVEFHGNNEGERHGWDGLVDAGAATPWIPQGRSVWEFGCNANPASKIENDYRKRVANTPVSERHTLHYVAVTPKSWTGKDRWLAEKVAEGAWKSIRVIDASNLEQWIEQSIQAQSWFAAVTGKPTKGVHSLSQFQTRWQADCKPALSSDLFTQAINNHATTVTHWLNRPETELLKIEADSTIEGVAFLNEVLSLLDNGDAKATRDRCVVVEDPALIPQLLTTNTSLVPVLLSRSTQSAFGPYHHKIRAVSVSHRGATSTDADITLDLLSYDAFRDALESMGLRPDEIDRLRKESGGSLTVLRRRLSGLDAIRNPVWSTDVENAQALIPMVFAGSWNARVDIDREIVEALSPDLKYMDTEKQFAKLKLLEDAPVWSAGSFCGVVSKIDALFAINPHVTSADLNRFFELAELVLSEDDPSIDLPEDERYFAGIHGKTRDISGALRRGVRDMLTLLAIYGNDLFKLRLGFDCEARAAQIVRKLMTPLSPQILEGHSADLPSYAEIAPIAFLEIIEADLENGENSECRKLMRPASTAFGGGCPRTGLLWALENLAWMPDHLARVVNILGHLSAIEIDDNWANKPVGSLQSTFRAWMPQTSADVDQRKAALDLLCQNHPEIGWKICIDQFDRMNRIGEHSHKFDWRTDSQNRGDPITNKEYWDFVIYSVSKTLNWPSYGRDKLTDLIRCADNLDAEFQPTLWGAVKAWAVNQATDPDKAWVREQVRMNVYSLRAAKKAKNKENDSPFDPNEIQSTYAALEPKQLAYKHWWLFRNEWIEPSAEELNEEEFNYEKRSEWVRKKQLEALQEIYSQSGVDGIIQLGEVVDSKSQIGRLFAKFVAPSDNPLGVATDLIGDSKELDDLRKDLLFGVFSSLTPSESSNLLLTLSDSVSEDIHDQLLLLARFEKSTWKVVEMLPQSRCDRYWSLVAPRLFHDQKADLDFAVQKLLEANRPLAAFRAVQYQLEDVSADLVAKMLERSTNSDERNETEVFPLERHYIVKAFEALDNSGQFENDYIAGLEYRYLKVLSSSERGVPALEKEIEKQPELYADFIAFMYKRDDGNVDPERLQLPPEQASTRASHAYHVFSGLKFIPGRDKEGSIQANGLIAWIDKAVRACEQLSRREIGEHKIGQLLANSPVDGDGTWPCEPVRTALEKCGTKSMLEGFRIGKYNLRGVVTRGEGGAQERELEKMYQSWASSVAYSHPKVAATLRKIADGYRHEAEYHDTEAIVRRRLPY